MNATSVTTVEDAHVPGSGQRLTRYFRAGADLSLKIDAMGVRIVRGNAFTFVPWANVVDVEGTTDEDPVRQPGGKR